MSHKLSILVYMSARDVIPEFKALGENLGALIAENKDVAIWGGGDAGLMGTFAQSSFLAGAETFGVAHGGLARSGHEVATNFATISMVPDNFQERIRIMQGAADAVIVLPGGYGSYQELLRLVKALEDGSVPKIPFILVNSKVDDVGFWDNAIAQLQLAVKRGHLKPWVLDYLRVVPDEQQAYQAAQNFYQGFNDAQWAAHKSQQLLYVPQHHAPILNDSSSGSLLKHKHKKLPPNLVAVLGSSLGASELEPANREAFDVVSQLMDMIEHSGNKVICINSNRGMNNEIMSHAARRNILGMVLSTRPQMLDGRVGGYNFAGAPHAMFDNAAQLSGFVTRKAQKIVALPGADDLIMDVLSDFAIKSHRFSQTQLLPFNVDGYYTQMLRQIQFMEQPRFAKEKVKSANGKDQMTGLATAGIAGDPNDPKRDPKSKLIVPFAFTSQDFFEQVDRMLTQDDHPAHYPAVKPDYRRKVDIPGIQLANSTAGLKVARALLHGPDLARPDARTMRRVNEAIEIARNRRKEMLLAR
jgi:uncharacterized protein (TIGR00730 family)